MFINIEFGYKQNKFFSINCMSYPLMDNIIQNVISESITILKKKSDSFKKNKSEIELELVEDKKNKESLELKIQEKIDNNEIKKPEVTSKSNKINKAEVKDPLEEQLDLTNQKISKSESDIEEYVKKSNLIKSEIEKYNLLKKKQTNNFDLIDNTSTRKYINTKLEQRGSEFLTEKKKYYLVLLKEDNIEEIELITISGYILRTIEEDLNSKNEVEFSLNLNNKKGNKKK